MGRLFGYIFLGSILLSLFDVVKSPFFLTKTIGITAGQVLYVIFIYYIASRVVGYKLLSGKLLLLSLFLGFATFILGALLTFAEVVGGPNFVYSKIFINTDKILILSLYLVAVGIIGQSNFFFERFGKAIITASFIFSALWMLFYSLLPGDRFEQLVKERDLIENIQFIVLSISSIVAFKLAAKLLKRKRSKKHAIVYFVITIILAVVALDEIAWGQKIINFSTPDLVARYNVQTELTLHNTRSIVGFVSFAYILIGIYGSLASYFVKNKLYAPDKVLFPYFLTPALYNIIAMFHIKGFGVWSEPSELVLYTGVCLFIIQNFYSQKYK